MAVDFEFFGVPALSELADGSYGLVDGGEEKLSEGVRVLLLASAAAAVLFTEELDDEDSLYVESSQGENRAFNWPSSEGGIQTEEGVVDHGTCVMTRNDLSFVGALR